jgi:chromosome segregation ATPase
MEELRESNDLLQKIESRKQGDEEIAELADKVVTELTVGLTDLSSLRVENVRQNLKAQAKFQTSVDAAKVLLDGAVAAAKTREDLEEAKNQVEELTGAFAELEKGVGGMVTAGVMEAEKARTRDLSERVESLESRLQDVKGQLSATQDAFQEKTGEIKQLGQEIRLSEAKIEELGDQIEERNSKVLSLQGDLRIQCDDFALERSELENSKRQLEDELLVLKTRKDDLQAAEAHLNTEIHTMTRKLAVFENEKVDWERTIEAYENLKDDKLTWVAERTRLSESVSSLVKSKDELAKSKDELAISKGKAEATFEGEKAQWRNERAGLEGTMSLLRKANAELEKDLNNLRSQLTGEKTARETEKAKLNETINSLKETGKETQDKLNSAKEERDGFQLQVVSLAREKTTLEKERGKLKEDGMALQERLDLAEQERDVLRENNSTLVGDKNLWETDKAKLEQVISTTMAADQ